MYKNVTKLDKNNNGRLNSYLVSKTHEYILTEAAPVIARAMDALNIE